MTWPIRSAAIYVGIAAEKAGDFRLGARFLGRAIDRLREQGRLGLLTQALVHYAWAATHAGDWSAAAGAGSEGARLARDTDQPQYGLTGELIAGLVAGLRGNEPDLEERIAGPERTLMAMNGGPLLAPAHLARGAAALGNGQYEEAFRQLWPVFDEADPAFHRFMRWPAALDLVEAARGSGRSEQAAAVIAELEAIAARSGPPLLLVLLACARPLLAGEQDAHALFEAALGQDRAAYPYPRARTLFAFGRWLRRQRRGIESRAPLREAIELFDVLGASRWSDRARQELRATGETSARGGPMLAISSPPRSFRSRSSRPKVCQIARSASDCSSLTARSARTSTGSFPSSGSPPARSCTTRFPPPPTADESVARLKTTPGVPVTIVLLGHPHGRGSQHERFAERRARARRLGRRVELERRRRAPPGRRVFRGRAAVS